MPMFRDRKDAGERLAALLLHLKDRSPIVLALPRGGVAIGAEIARLLGAPLDIVLVRKIGVPWQRELALGAVADGGTPEIFIDERMAESLAVPGDYMRAETARQPACVAISAMGGRNTSWPAAVAAVKTPITIPCRVWNQRAAMKAAR